MIKLDTKTQYERRQAPNRTRMNVNTSMIT
ncbi:MAG: hypothetical protein C207_00039 [Bradyrhizobium sp. DFCI-1]|jgi:hypothetical protein|nr:MAG: hypothetical protein C207_00039 [Bradyrhizobium sp. DFCI-1]WIG49428.1 MAG: hypothetical protein OJF48_000344 [Afipia sp.]